MFVGEGDYTLGRGRRRGERKKITSPSPETKKETYLSSTIRFSRIPFHPFSDSIVFSIHSYSVLLCSRIRLLIYLSLIVHHFHPSFQSIPLLFIILSLTSDMDRSLYLDQSNPILSFPACPGLCYTGFAISQSITSPVFNSSTIH